MARRSKRDGDELELFRLIAAGDDREASRMLAAAPQLARVPAPVGATRANPAPYYLDDIEHYVYAGDTALHIAAAGYRPAIARELVALDAAPHARNRHGAEPLHYASVGRPGSPRWNPEAQVAVIEFLIGAGADPRATDKRGVTPLHVAVRTRCAAAVHALLAHGADPRRTNGSGSTAADLAAKATGRGGSGSSEAKAEQAAIQRLLAEHGGSTRRIRAD
jgi:hypothetical protein